MLLIPCPHCGPRAEIEFSYAGEAHRVRPSGNDVSDEAWGAYLYLRDNKRGFHAERWCHVHGCSQFFNLERDTVTDRITGSYPAGAKRPAAGGER